MLLLINTMADFCSQCSIEIFGADYHELALLGRGKELLPGCGYVTICEGCGVTRVDLYGKCLGDCAKHPELNNPLQYRAVVKKELKSCT